MRQHRFGDVVRRLGKAATTPETRKFIEPGIVGGPRWNQPIWQELRARLFRLAHADTRGDPTFSMSFEQAKGHFMAQTYLMKHYVDKIKASPEVMKEVMLPPDEVFNKQPKPPLRNTGTLYRGLPILDSSSQVAIIGRRRDMSKVTITDNFEVKKMVGVSMPMAYIPIGTLIHGIEMNIGQGQKVSRAKGSYSKIVKKQEDRPRVTVRLPSGQDKVFDSRCCAVVGPATNPNYVKPKLYKAGQNRLLGKRPRVRGIAKNPVDHPHGGRTNGGRPSCDPWGNPCKCGYKPPKKRKRTILK